MKKVVLIGLGAVGLTYAVKLKNKCDLKILADEERINKYKKNSVFFNNEKQDFNYILPSEKFSADFVIISTKSQGLDSAIKCIKNVVSNDTTIISLINGVTSEEKISAAYPFAKVLKSYFIGHSALRVNNSVTQDGIGELVIEHDTKLEEFLKFADINYSVPDDIDYSMWLKYVFNLFSNQTSAILNLNFKSLKRNQNFINFAKKIVSEVKAIAKYKGVNNLNNIEEDSISALEKMCDEGKTSMLQDILACRPTEVDIFAGEIIRMGKTYGVPTPYNQVLYDLIKIKEEDNEYSIHSGEGRQ